MSLKRKTNSKVAEGPAKKTKSDFFAPRVSADTTVAPIAYNFGSKPEGSIRLTTWNVNGIKSVDEKILKRYLEAEDPDILVLTETKCSKPDVFCLKTRFKYQSWGIGTRPGQAGTAILSKHKPLNTIIGLPTWPDAPDETAGRYVEFEFHDIFLVATYVPNSGENFKFMETKQKWNTAFTRRLRELDSQKPVIWAGDFNCIPSKNDLDDRAQQYWNNMSGLSENERTEFDEQLNPRDDTPGKLVDAWRHLHPDVREYTHASAKFGAWRLDSFIMSERILHNATGCEIRHVLKDSKCSDHWPVTLDVTGLFSTDASS